MTLLAAAAALENTTFPGPETRRHSLEVALATKPLSEAGEPVNAAGAKPEFTVGSGSPVKLSRKSARLVSWVPSSLARPGVNRTGNQLVGGREDQIERLAGATGHLRDGSEASCVRQGDGPVDLRGKEARCLR